MYSFFDNIKSQVFGYSVPASLFCTLDIKASKILICYQGLLMRFYVSDVSMNFILMFKEILVKYLHRA